VANATVVTSSYNGSYTSVTLTINSGLIVNNKEYFCYNFTSPATGEVTCVSCVPQFCSFGVTINLVDRDSGDIINTQTYNGLDDNSYVIVPNYSYTLSQQGNYYIDVIATDCCNTVSCRVNFSVCYNYSLVKTACHNYRLTDSQVIPSKVNTVTISNMDGSYTDSFTFNTATSDYVDIIVPKDGVYQIAITNDVFTNSVVTFTLYDFCDILSCYKKLFLYVYCREKDPCCENCEPKQLEEYRKKRYEMEKLLALGGILFGYLYKNSIDAYGSLIATGAEEFTPQEINEIFKKINEITFRCGECDKDKPVVPPCLTCQ
jgi:hypothetical protein